MTGTLLGFQLGLNFDECVRSNFQLNSSFDICVLGTMCLRMYVCVRKSRNKKHLSIHSNRNRNDVPAQDAASKRGEKRRRANEWTIDMEVVVWTMCFMCVSSRTTNLRTFFVWYSALIVFYIRVWLVDTS